MRDKNQKKAYSLSNFRRNFVKPSSESASKESRKSLIRESSKESFKSYNITFNKIDGIQVGTDVLISGVKVGFVDKVSLEKNYPLVSVMIDKNIVLPNDSSISIQTDGLFGAKFMSIEIGGSEESMNEYDFFSFYEDSILVEDLLKKIIEIGEIRKNES